MPEIGRFISEDPWAGTITTPTTMNPYPYVVNNPLKYVDPLGLVVTDSSGGGSSRVSNTKSSTSINNTNKQVQKQDTKNGSDAFYGKLKGPTLMEAAEMAEHVYLKYSVKKAKEDVLLGGWKLDDIYQTGSLRTGIYARTNANGIIEYTLANRGTQDFAWNEDGDDNVLQLFGKSEDMKNSIAYAAKFVKDNPDVNITFVGHSKGGAEASANAVATNKNAILFNPATVNLKAYGLSSSKYTASMTAYIVEGDALNKVEGWFSKPIGSVVYLPIQYPINSWNLKKNVDNAKKNHSISAVKDAIKEWEANK